MFYYYYNYIHAHRFYSFQAAEGCIRHHRHIARQKVSCMCEVVISEWEWLVSECSYE